jgi:hypothetical protein
MLKTASGPNGEVAVQLLESWLPSFPKTLPEGREYLSGVLAALVGGVLREPKRKDAKNRLLDAFARTTFPWLLAMEEARDTTNFWIVARANDLAQARKPSSNISLYGAGLIASSIEKAKAGLTGEALLKALALNLGMELIAESDDGVRFDPNIHEDTAGGLLKGDVATVTESGWRLGDQIVRRAKVTPAPDA